MLSSSSAFGASVAGVSAGGAFGGAPSAATGVLSGAHIIFKPFFWVLVPIENGRALVAPDFTIGGGKGWIGGRKIDGVCSPRRHQRSYLGPRRGLPVQDRSHYPTDPSVNGAMSVASVVQSSYFFFIILSDFI